MNTQSSTSFIAWSPIGGRAREIAALLDGDAFVLSAAPSRGVLGAAVRYAVRILQTSWHLARRRPRTVVASSPPVLCGALAVVYGFVSGARVLVDAHPGSFGAQGDALSGRLQPLHRWAVARADATLVTTDDWAATVRAWNGYPLIVHEAPPGRGPFTPSGGGRRVLFVCTFEPDEPVEEVFAAAAALPDVHVVVTGDVRKRPGVERLAPGNVELVGFLSADAYWRQVEQADVVLALTTEPTSVQRAGYEAVYAERVLVVSDWPVARDVFPKALHVVNSATGIGEGIREALDRLTQLQLDAPEARRLQERRWSEQLGHLRASAGLAPAAAHPDSHVVAAAAARETGVLR